MICHYKFEMVLKQLYTYKESIFWQKKTRVTSDVTDQRCLRLH